MPTRVYTGFDSAWSANNEGAVVSAVNRDGAWTLTGPVAADYQAAWEHVKRLDADANYHALAIDQPLIVRNGDGQRPVEGVAGSPVGRRLGGACSSNRGQHGGPAAANQRMMFGDDAPVWRFLGRLAGIGFEHNPRRADRAAAAGTGRFCFEVYPALANLGLFPVFFNPRPLGGGRTAARVPKYNPANANFEIGDWQALCACVAQALAQQTLQCPWLAAAAGDPAPRKPDQDKLDALICLCIALHWTLGDPACMIGDLDTGYMVVPTHPPLSEELRAAAASRRVPFWP
jgi:predicted RNase H-like nuclease